MLCHIVNVIVIKVYFIKLNAKTLRNIIFKKLLRIIIGTYLGRLLYIPFCILVHINVLMLLLEYLVIYLIKSEKITNVFFHDSFEEFNML